MPDIMIYLYILMGFVILASIVAIEAVDLLSTVISVSAAGAGLAIIFLLLGAPDLAITQVVVEVVVLIILIRCVLTRKDTTVDTRPSAFSVGVGLVFGGVLVVVAAFCFQDMIPFANPLMTTAGPYLKIGLEQTGAANYVTAVLLDFRAYDTLGEATVIFTAIVGAYAVLRTIGRISHAGHDTNR